MSAAAEDRAMRDVGDEEVSSSEDEDEEIEDAQTANRQAEWEEWEDNEEASADATRSLFSQQVLGSPEEAMDYDAKHHGFDLRNFIVQECLDDYGVMRLINFIRSEVAAGRDPLPALRGDMAAAAADEASEAAAEAVSWREDDRYLQPTCADDPLLFHEFEEYISRWQHGGPAAAAAEPGPSEAAGPASPSTYQALHQAQLLAELQRLRGENEGLREALAAMRLAFLPEELREEMDAGASGSGPSAATTPAAAAAPSSAQQGQAEAEGAPASSSSGKGKAEVEGAAQPHDSRDVRGVDEAYFDSYGGFDIHREMLSDKPRTEAYQQALERNPGLVRGKVVMDVGCGTGILSMFACRGGAAKVVSVDGSERIAGFARQICALNGYSSEAGGPMTVLSGKVEELQGLPVDKVDVIVSEWMGYALLFETMLDSVLHARDKWLRPGGAVLPDVASIHLAGVGPQATGLAFWKDVYGFDMSPIASNLLPPMHGKGNVLEVKKEDLVTEPACVKELDLCTMRSEDQDFSAEFTLQATAGATAPQECHALALWFDTDFSSRHCPEHPVKLSTSPMAPITHWAQTVLLLKAPILLSAGSAGQQGSGSATASCITGRLSMVRSRLKHRSLDISLEYRAVLSDGSVVQEAVMYHMNVLAAS